MPGEPIRVLIVDDTVIYRKIVQDLLAVMPGVEVVGTAPNGRIALQKIEQLRPDLLTLDLEMPEIDGLGVLQRLKSARSTVGAIMLSAFTTAGADATMDALRLGAFDFVVKPSGGTMEANVKALDRDLRQKIEAFARRQAVRSALQGAGPRAATPATTTTAPEASRSANAGSAVRRMHSITARNVKPAVVALGISTGGPPALTKMIPELPADLSAPILIVQHMPPKFTRSLANDLNARSPLNVTEATDGQPVRAGQILVAPGGRQMKVDRENGGLVVRITDDPPENHCQPAVDYLFRSVANVCGRAAIGVIMTGMGSDGTLGCRLMKRRGATIVAQSAESCVVYGMPKGPIEEGIADVVAPLDRIGGEITRLVGRRSTACSSV